MVTAVGIGLAISKVFAQQGAHNILEVNAAGEAAVQEITEAGGTATARTGDVTDQAGESGLDAMADDALIDCLINNAGIAHVGNVLNTSEEDFDRVLSVNVKGVYNCLQAASPT